MKGLKGIRTNASIVFFQARMTRNFTERIKQRLCKSVSSVPKKNRLKPLFNKPFFMLDLC